MGGDGVRTLRGALAGAVAAGTWAAQQPVDKRVFGCSYDDVELLGKLITRDRAWPAAGIALHLGNGALFGAAYSAIAPSVPLPPAVRGPAAGMIEHLGLWPAGRLTDRFHPARGELPRLGGNRRAFWQATWRHLLFGLVLGELERRLNPEPEPVRTASSPPAFSSNGHGSLEDAVLAEPRS